jgi:hypothetical protein
LGRSDVSNFGFISPRCSVPLFGRAGLRNSTHVSSQLEANIVVLKGSTGLVVLVGLDTLFSAKAFEDAVRERLSASQRDRIEALLFVASHTHNAPALDSTKARLGIVDAAYFEETVTSVADLIGRAVEGAQRGGVGTLKRGRASSDMNAYRRRRGLYISRHFPFIELAMINAADPHHAVSHELDMLVAFGEDGHPLWAIWTWPCHATSSADRTGVSADFPGVVRTALRSRLDAPQLPVVYLPGFSGDVSPYVDKSSIPRRALVEHPLTRLFSTNTQDHFDRLCSDLSLAATAAIDALAPISSAERVRYGASKIELAKVLEGDGPAAVHDIGVHALSFGDTGLLLVGAEVCSPYRAILSDVIPSDWLVSGLCNEVFGYLPTDQQITEGGYEVSGFLRYFGLTGALRRRIQHHLVEAAGQAVSRSEAAHFKPPEQSATRPIEHAVGRPDAAPNPAASRKQMVGLIPHVTSQGWRHRSLSSARRHLAILAGILSAALLAATCLWAAGVPTVILKPAKSWEQYPSVAMEGGLAAYWNVVDKSKGENGNEAQAHARGFRPVTILNTYSDYQGDQAENIDDYLGKSAYNPWDKPTFFEPVIRRNIASAGTTGTFVHDIEFDFDQNSDRAWADPKARTASGITDRAAFDEAYFKEWASWFALPAIWAKQKYPDSQIGIYGPQPFRRDYWGIADKSAAQVDGTHTEDWRLWKYIDPHVDFYIASIYVFYPQPDSVYYMAANVEENHERTRQIGDKPLFAYEWLRYHDKGSGQSTPEVDPYLVEAMAIVPYFSGARAVVLWGYEPQVTRNDPGLYNTLPIYMHHLSRVARLSALIGGGKLEIDTPAHVLWNKREPLVRRIVTGPEACVFMAINAWQNEAQSTVVEPACGSHKHKIEIVGRSTVLAVANGDRLELY